MKHSAISFFIVVTIFTATTMNSTRVSATELPNLMIVGTYNKDAIPRNTHTFNRVVNEIANGFNGKGFDVYDETALTLPPSHQSNTDLIDAIRSIKSPPIDVIVLFDLYASAKQLEYTTKIHTHLSARLLDAQSGRRMGNVEISDPANLHAPATCNPKCILDTVGNNARLLAAETVNILHQKLRNEIDNGYEYKKVSRKTNLKGKAQLPVDYSAVIIDLEKAMFLPILTPEIINENNVIIYSQDTIKNTEKLENGFIHYSKSVGKAQNLSVSGNKPLIIKAKHITTDNRIVISNKDANIIAPLKALQQGRLVIALD